MTKNLHNVIMTRSRLLNKYRKEKTETRRSVYIKKEFVRKTTQKKQKGFLQ